MTAKVHPYQGITVVKQSRALSVKARVSKHALSAHKQTEMPTLMCT